MELKAEEKTRIYVGGLGEKVTSDDLLKIFSSLGGVKGVEIVRSKGRSFGYVDFYPYSDKSLSKLFSTYNGCVWKGGRLRLEKAKEHYLARLKREWDEDAQLASSQHCESVDADKDVASLKKSQKILNSANNIHIFFPRLRKVKPLPFSGTGKHKYSFQRVEARPLPMYFCDCEEHSIPFCTAEGKQIHSRMAKQKKMDYLEAESGGMNEEELNIMNSVMNKLFEKKNVSNAAYHGTDLASDGNNLNKSIEDLQLGDDEADISDEDNLIINVVSKGNNKMALSRCQEKTTISPINQKSTVSETRNSKARPGQKVPDSQKKDNLLSNKKRKSHLSEESVRNEFVSANHGGDMNLQKPLGSRPAETETVVKQSTADCSWSQKLSWKALVGDKDSSVFNVSNILPAVESTKEADNSVEPIEALDFDENDTDEDNIIINVISKKKKGTKLPGNQEQESEATVIQKSTVNETQTSEDRTGQSVLKAQRKSTLTPKKKRKSLSKEKSDRNELVITTPGGSDTLQTHTNRSTSPSTVQLSELESGVKQPIAYLSVSQKSSQEEIFGEKGKDAFSVSKVLSDLSAKEGQQVSSGPNVPNSVDSKEEMARLENLEGKLNEKEIVEVLEVQPTKTNERTDKAGRGSSWFQKSSWTQLVTNNNNSFSITQLSPGITIKKPELTKSHEVLVIAKNGDSKSNNLVKQDKSEPPRSGSPTVDTGKDADMALNFGEEKQLTVVENNEASTSIVENEYDSVQRQMTDEVVSIGETCSFMRSAASLKEWAKTKAALSGSLKKKKQ